MIRKVEVALAIMKPLDGRAAPTVQIHVQDHAVSHDYLFVDLTAAQFASLLAGTVVPVDAEVGHDPEGAS